MKRLLGETIAASRSAPIRITVVITLEGDGVSMFLIRMQTLFGIGWLGQLRGRERG